MSQSLFSELKRRQIYRGGVMYVVAGWVIVQIATQVFPFFDIPVWAIRLVIVVIMLGFPLSLVWLWMFESNLPDAAPVDRRAGRDPAGDLAKLMERERGERQKENQDLIAALAQLKATPASMAEAPGPALDRATLDHPSNEAPTAPGTPAFEPLATSPPSPPARPRKVPMLLTLVAVLIIAAGVWSLVMPQTPLQVGAVSGEITQRYVVPGFYQVEHVSVEWLRPRLHKYGIGIAPEWVFDGVLVLIAWMILRNLLRAFIDARRRRDHAAAQA